MKVCARLVLLGVLLAGLGTTAAARPAFAGAAATVKKIETLNGEAMEAYLAGDLEGAKSMLLDAVVLAKTNGMGSHVAVARSNLNLGLVHVDGFKDEEKGERYFRAALAIDPKVQLKADKASAAVARVFDRARGGVGGQALEQKKKDDADKILKNLAQAREQEAKEVAERERKEREEQGQKLKELATLREREAKEAKLREAKQREEQDKILKDLAVAREREAKEREQRARDERTKLERDLSAALDREKKERSLKEDLQKDKDELKQAVKELEKALSDAKSAAREQEKQERQTREKLEKERKEIDKKLAEAEGREKKEREAKEKLETEKQIAVLRDKDSKLASERAEHERERRAEGPAFPGSLSQKVTCHPPEDHTRGNDVFFHCAAQPGVKAESLTLFYRPSGSARFSSVPMERTRKGWSAALVPAAVIKGTMLQYYVEAKSESGRTVATAGKPAFPNVLTVNRWPTTPVASAQGGR